MNIEMLDPKITRFMILSDGRSGTMMLTDTLDTLPFIHFFNLFAVNIERSEQYWNNWEKFQQKNVNGITHLGTTMHRVGDQWLSRFKGIDTKEFWGIVANKHEKVICLHRKNKLKQLLSRKVGYLIKSYKVSSPRKTNPEPVYINPNELDVYARELDQLREYIDAIYNDKIEIEFETMVNDWDTTISKVCSYLRIAQVDLKPVTHKQETRNLKESITNYDEVKNHLVETGRTDWIDDD